VISLPRRRLLRQADQLLLSPLVAYSANIDKILSIGGFTGFWP
jgi:hypothetical protein